MLGTLTRRQIEEVLRAGTIGRLGMSADGKAYVVPITYVYDGDSVYGHTTVGQKVRMMRKNPEVCFETDDIKDMANWRSVIAQGRYEELSGDVAVAAAKLIAARLGPLTTSATAGPAGSAAHRNRTQVSYRIRLVERSGRFERQAAKRRKGGSRG
jgi:nitroimidazol reductase NimA-like FMN-containing flavoprotein (pyridoxamine 5'-phosphate oxidase superfamily)